MIFSRFLLTKKTVFFLRNLVKTCKESEPVLLRSRVGLEISQASQWLPPSIPIRLEFTHQDDVMRINSTEPVNVTKPKLMLKSLKLIVTRYRISSSFPPPSAARIIAIFLDTFASKPFILE
jgi:hypothetical protein